RRYLVDADSDDQRDVYVQVLEHFYRNGLAAYDGRTALSTWVMTVARSRSLDFLRARLRRQPPPAWLASLSAAGLLIYRLYYLQGESYAAIAQAFKAQGEVLSIADWTTALDRIEERMDPKLRTRLAYDLQARSVGACSGRLLELLEHLARQGDEVA